jgi:uncharacterized protein with PIN domain
MGAAVLIVLDSSALVSVLLGEDEAAAVARALDANSPRLLSAANLLEAAMVIESRKGEAGGASSTCSGTVSEWRWYRSTRTRQSSHEWLGGGSVEDITLPR